MIVVMGVTGSGKSTVGRELATRINGEFLDADDYHPAANKTKMAAGIPLDDTDRAGWLETLANLLRERLTTSKPVVLACSALKDAYRQRLQVSPEVSFVYLKGDPELIRSRLEARKDHFMNPRLLESQFLALEEPQDCLVLDIGLPVSDLVDQIVKKVRLG